MKLASGITLPFVLAPNVLCVPVQNFSTRLRRQFRAGDQDVAITHVGSRTPSKIISGHLASLLDEFKTRKTIVDAILNYSKRHGCPAEKALNDVFPSINQFIQARILVRSDSSEASKIGPMFKTGDYFLRFKIIRCIQALEDIQVYQVKMPDGHSAALKMATGTSRGKVMQSVRREALILKGLTIPSSPKLIAHGIKEGRAYLVMDWCEGVPITKAAELLRSKSGSEARSKMIRLATEVLMTYAQLHRRGVIHGDVNPNNILIGANGKVTIIDFGLAQITSSKSKLAQPARGGVAFFLDPALAASRMIPKNKPRATSKGEQYSLAALIYLLITGEHYLDFSIEKQLMLKQIIADAPIPLKTRGIFWPEIEPILFRALEKKPHLRFSSISQFAKAFKWATKQKAINRTSPHIGSANQSLGSKFIDSVVQHVSAEGSITGIHSLGAPLCSVQYGAAGIACGLYRIAVALGRAELLSLADVWIIRAVEHKADEGAFYNPRIGITQEIVGKVSPYHTESGIHAVAAFIAHARGDATSQYSAIDSFISASQVRCDNIDLTLGRSGTLLVASLLLDLPSPAGTSSANGTYLKRFGNKLLLDIWKKVNHFGPIADDRRINFLGMAHGWAGILYATLQWCRSARVNFPSELEARLHELLACGQNVGAGMRWRVKNIGKQFTPKNDDSKSRSHGDFSSGWCNGSAGYVFLWSIAAKQMGNDKFKLAAEQAALNTWDEATDTSSLCCGLSGAIYALMQCYRQTNNRKWLNRAYELRERLIKTTVNKSHFTSLFKGDIGVAAVLADMKSPDSAAMPLFESEVWPLASA